jgi:RHS repeat-associated protein
MVSCDVQLCPRSIFPMALGTFAGMGDSAQTPTNSSCLQHSFPGQYADPETGLSYNMARDFDPSFGRFVESDPIGLSAGTNTYAYVGDNPVNMIDPDGMSACPPTAAQFINRMCHAAKDAGGKNCPCKVMLIQSGFESGWGTGPTVADNNYFGLHGVGDRGSRPAKKDPNVKLPVNSSPEQSYRQYCTRCGQYGIQYDNDDGKFIADVTKRLGFSIGTQPQYIRNIVRMMTKCKDEIASCCSSP